MILAAGFFLVGVSSLALIARELRKAPEAYEDEHGFHIVSKKAVRSGVPGSVTTKTRSSRQSSPTALPSVMQKDRKTALFRRGDGLGSWIQLRSAII